MIIEFAFRPKNEYQRERNGNTIQMQGVTVKYVLPKMGERRPDIDFKRYTADYSDIRSRPYIVTKTGIGYSTLESAVKAIKRLNEEANRRNGK